MSTLSVLNFSSRGLSSDIKHNLVKRDTSPKHWSQYRNTISAGTGQVCLVSPGPDSMTYFSSLAMDTCSLSPTQQR